MADQIVRYVELKEESAYGTPAAAGSGVYLDINSTTLDVPGEPDSIVESAFGRAARKKYPAFYAPEGNIVYQMNVRTVAHLLKWGLGGYAFTAGTGTPPSPNTHECWGSDDRILKSFTSRVGKDVFEHVFQGCVIGSLEIEVEDELTQLTAEIAAQRDSKAALQNRTTVFNALPSEPEIPFHQVTVSIGGQQQTNKVKSLTISVENNADAEAGRYLGNRYPGRLPANEREVTLSLELDFSSTAELERLWGGTSGPTLNGSSEVPISVTFAGGTQNGHQMDVVFTFPRVFYTSVETQPSGREEMTQSIEARALTGNVTLLDNSTQVTTDIYARVRNYASAVSAT